MEETLPWTNSVKTILEKNGMLSFYLNDYSSKPPFISKRVFDRIVDTFHQNSFASINTDTSKLRTYALFKKKYWLRKILVWYQKCISKNPSY